MKVKRRGPTVRGRPPHAPAPSPTATTRKLAVSFEKGLAAKVEESAARAKAGNVSGWLAEAAEQKLRLEAGKELLDLLLDGRPPLTAEELEEVEREWPRKG